MDPLYLNINESAKFTSMSRSALYECLKDGRIAAKKAGRRTLISVAELRAYMASLPSMVA